MIQFICDRCKEIIPEETVKKQYATYQIRKRIKEDLLAPPLDLCPKCYKYFDKWLKDGGTQHEDN